MDRLCSLSSQTESSSNEKQTKKQKVATMAWAAFQVLANRCVEWEKEEGRNTAAVFLLCASELCKCLRSSVNVFTIGHLLTITSVLFGLSTTHKWIQK